MKNILLGLAIPLMLHAQPDQWPVTINPAEVSKLLDPSRRTIEAFRIDAANSPVVDGEKDAIWEKVAPVNYDRYVTHHTEYKNGSYIDVSDLSDGSNSYRLPIDGDDFNGNFRVTYSQDYIYCFIDVTDNEVNDNTTNIGLRESFEIQEAPYADSVQQMLMGKPYPPYIGKAPEINKKYSYWAYLGAFKFWFFLAPKGKCTSEIRQKADAIGMIDYQQRLESCECAWKMKADGTGYTAEIALSLHVALADSDLNPLKVPSAAKDIQSISFEMKCYDEDLGLKPIQASWNSENDNVWDAMIYSGKLVMRGWTVSMQENADNQISLYPNPANDILFINKLVEAADVLSSNGMVLYSVKKTNQINISTLTPGLYILKTSDSCLRFVKK